MEKKILIFAAAAFFITAGITIIAQPVINSVSDSPDPVEVPGYNNITADITNATSAYVEISYPNATLMGNFSMTQVGVTTTWYYNHTYAYPDPLGTYSYIVKAYNATGWSTSATYNFVIQDTTDPTSNVDSMPYWYNAQPITITATASDNYEVSNVSLWYRFSTDNATWGAWTFFGKDTAAPYSFSFTFPSGEGYYEFYTIANDTAGNTEAAPLTADENAGYDATAPASSVDAMSYWYNTLPVVVTATASDSISGVSEVTLYYRYSSDNSSWGTWTAFSTDSASPWQWNFNAPDGDGYYELYTIAKDNATNTEAAPLSADESICIDISAPATSMHAGLPRYGNYVTSSTTFNLTATDSVGVNATYYRIWYGGWNPSPGTGSGIGNNFSVYSANFTLSGSGTHYIEFYSDDIAGNNESVHNSTYIVDNTSPSISSVAATPSTQSQGGKVNISCQSSDSGVGINKVYVEVVYPDCSTANFTMYYIPCTHFYRDEAYSVVGTYDYTIYAVDLLGNGITSGVYHFTITSSGDTTPPVTTCTLEPAVPDGPGGWYVSPVKVTLTATDDDTGVNYTKYRVDNGSWLTYTSYFMVSTNGYHQVDYYSVDNANNVETTKHVNFKINISNPVTSYTLDPALPNGENGWYVTNVTVNLTAVDPDGIDYTKYRINGGSWITYSSPFKIMSDGVNLVEFYSVDLLGHAENIKSFTVKIDKTNPTISLQRPRFGYLYLFDREIMPLASGITFSLGRLTVTASALDSTSGIGNVTFYTDGIPQSIDLQSPYQWIWGGDVGTRVLYAVAYDEAGNSKMSDAILVTIISL